MAITHKYVVTLRRDTDTQDFVNKLTSTGSDHSAIPERAVVMSNEKPASLRSFEFLLTDEEMINLKLHEDVLGIDSLTSLVLFKKRNAIQKDFFTRSSASHPFETNWGLRRSQVETTDDYYKNSAYKYVLDGTGVDVVIQDDGVHPDHPEFHDSEGNSRVHEIDWYTETGLAGTMPASHYTYDNYHGNHVASTACGKYHGFAKNARIYNIRFDSAGGLPAGDEFDLVRLWHEQKPVDPITGYKRPTIVNASWGYGWYVPGYDGGENGVETSTGNTITEINFRGTNVGTEPSEDYWFGTPPVQVIFFGIRASTAPLKVTAIDEALRDMIDAGVIFVHASGNDDYKQDIPGGQDYDNYFKTSEGWPNGYPNDPSYVPASDPVYYNRPGSPYTLDTIQVGNIHSTLLGESDYRSSSSNIGPAVNIWAPGTDIMAAGTSNQNTSEYRDSETYYNLRISGTSMAAPQVTGLLALFLQLNPHATQQDCINWLHNHGSRETVHTNQQNDDGNDDFSLAGGTNKQIFNPYSTSSAMRVNVDQDEEYYFELSDTRLDEHYEESTTITLYTTGLEDGSTVAYIISGDLQETDIAESLSGNFIIENNQASVTVTASRDFLNDGVKRGVIELVGRSESQVFLVNNTSVATPYIAVTQSSADLIREMVRGNSYTLTIEGFNYEGSDSSDRYRWLIQGAGIDGTDILPYYSNALQEDSEFVLDSENTSHNIVLQAREDANDQRDRAGQLLLLKYGPDTGAGNWSQAHARIPIGVVQPEQAEWTWAWSGTIVDYEGSPALVEGNSFTLTGTANNAALAPLGTRVYYRLVGSVSPFEISGISTNGSMVVNSTPGELSLSGYIQVDGPDTPETLAFNFYSDSNFRNFIGSAGIQVIDQ